MKQTVKRKHVVRALRDLGFSLATSGKPGHEEWRREDGKSVRPTLRKDEIPSGHCVVTGKILERQGVATVHEFLELCGLRG